MIGRSAALRHTSVSLPHCRPILNVSTKRPRASYRRCSRHTTVSMALLARPRENRADNKDVTHCLFDMDGLLLNTEDLYTIAQQEVLKPYGKEFTWDLKAKTMGMKALPASNLVVETLNLQGILSPEQFLKDRETILHKTFSTAKLLPGAERLLRHLHKNSIPICLATSSDAYNFGLKTTHHRELFTIFHHKVTGDLITNGKPAPDIFLYAADKFEPKPDPATCLVFEDAPNGVQAGKAAGMSVVMVPDSHMHPSTTQQADEVLDSLQDFDPTHWGLPAFSD